MKYYTLLLLVITLALQADVYRSVDEHGHVIFSDTSTDNAEKIELQQAFTYTAPVIVELAEDEQSPPPLIDIKMPNYKIVITSPPQNETLRENAGNVIIDIELSPELNIQRGDKLIFSLDGQLKSTMQDTQSYTFTNVDRGSHVASVSVVDKNGKLIKSSKSVLFHLQRIAVR
jgi:hypothetical protein